MQPHWAPVTVHSTGGRESPIHSTLCSVPVLSVLFPCLSYVWFPMPLPMLLLCAVSLCCTILSDVRPALRVNRSPIQRSPWAMQNRSCEFRVFCYFFEIKISSQRSACSPAHVSRISVFSQRGHCTLRTFSGERTTLFEFVVFAHDTQSARWYKPRSGWQPVQTSGCSLECPPTLAWNSIWQKKKSMFTLFIRANIKNSIAR